jgi:hypothetical protein
VTSFIEDLGGMIPTKTSRAIAQFLGRGPLDIVISTQVEVIRFWKVLVRLIFLAVNLSNCRLLFIVLSHLRTQMRYADSAINILNSLETLVMNQIQFSYSRSR